MHRWFRSFLLPSLAVAYIGFAAVQATGGSRSSLLALVVLPVFLAWVWRRTEVPPSGEGHVESAARLALRTGAWGATLWVAARTGPAGHPAFDASANVGVGATAVAGLLALARMSALGGLLKPHPATRSLDAAAFAGLLWGVAAAVPGTKAIVPAGSIELDPLTVDYATTAAAVGTLLVLIAACWRLRTLRRLELGVGDRTLGSLAISLTTFLVVVPSAALNVAPPDRLLPVGVLVASLFATWTASAAEPTTVSSALRGILAVVLLGAPTVLVSGLLARQLPEHAGGIVLGSSALAVLVGLIARAVARPLGPEQSRWLEAIDAASRGALQPEPDAAIRAALAALSSATIHANSRPELWRASPEEVLSVDLAGYLHLEQAQAPDRVYELALGEPERTLRLEVLRAVEVHHAAVRPLIAWFEVRGAFSATVVLDEDGPQGLLLLPGGGRRAPMTLEEARAIRILTDRISALLAVSSALARSRQRELSAHDRCEALERERQRLEQAIASGEGRHTAAAARWARSVLRTAYSPAARLALEATQRLGADVPAMALITPPGSDARGWAAAAHLASPRRGGPLILVEGACGYDHDPGLWQDPLQSPLRQAEGGTLVLLDGAALPTELQELVGFELLEAVTSGRTGPPPPGLVVTVSQQLGAAWPPGTLAAPLERLLAGRTVEVPALRARPEDLRALILDGLAQAGLRHRGHPLGLEPSALYLLLEYVWPGNDRELYQVLERVALISREKLVTVADLRSLAFPSTEEPGSPIMPPTAPPPSLRRRPSSRPRRPG